MKGIQKMVAGRVRMVFDSPFFAMIATTLELIVDETIPTACTNGTYIKFNPKFTDGLSKSQIVFLIAHEVLHIVLMSHLRMGNRDKRVWNMATDYAINILLSDLGFTLIQGGLLDEKFREWSAEKIYDYLIQNPEEQQPDDGVDGWNIGGVEPFTGPGGTKATEEQKALAESDIKSKIQAAIAIAKKAGKLSAGLDRIVDKICNPKADWREILSRFIGEVTFSDYDYTRSNTRMLYQYGIVNPVVGGESLGHILIGIDTSGSINEKQLSQFAGEINDVLENYDCSVTVLYCDTKISKVDEYSSNDLPLYLKATGGGGTDATEIYNYAKENDLRPACLIHLTDCYLNWDKIEDPGFPVLVAHNTSSVNGLPDFVELVDITD